MDLDIFEMMHNLGEKVVIMKSEIADILEQNKKLESTLKDHLKEHLRTFSDEEKKKRGTKFLLTLRSGLKALNGDDTR